MERRTKIVATIGPASSEPEVLVRMVDAGMDVARLNFSHGTAEQHAETAQRVRDAAGRAGRPVAILQDLPGPKLRIGALRDGTADLSVGDQPHVRLQRRQRRARRRAAHDDHVAPGSPPPSSPARSCTSPTASCACA